MSTKQGAEKTAVNLYDQSRSRRREAITSAKKTTTTANCFRESRAEDSYEVDGADLIKLRLAVEAGAWGASTVFPPAPSNLIDASHLRHSGKRPLTQPTSKPYETWGFIPTYKRSDGIPIRNYQTTNGVLVQIPALNKISLIQVSQNEGGSRLKRNHQ